jgi:hypothetical protein
MPKETGRLPNPGDRLRVGKFEPKLSIFDAERRRFVGVGAAIRPRIVCLCGSTRFSEAFQKANLSETLAGRIVLTVGCMTHSDAELGAVITPEVKEMLDRLHKKKIDLADEVLVLNVEGYIGSSTKGEVAHAFGRGKPIRFLDEKLGEEWMQANTHELGAMIAKSVMDEG